MNYKKCVKILFITVFLLVSVLGSLAAQVPSAERTSVSEGSPPVRDGNVTRRIGLFVGSNNGGRDRVMLRYAVSDARAVSRVFGDMGGISQEDNIILVEPTVAEINRRLDAVGRELSAARRDYQRTEMVFYYSGHSDEDGLLLNRERYSYMDLRERINRIDTDMRIVILDSCSSGAITRAKGGVKAPPFLFDSSVSVEGYAYLTSSSADEASQESDSIESSYFTHSIVAGLRGAADTVGDGKVTLNELYRFAYVETLAKTETSIYGAQHPSYDMQISGSGDVVLTDINETSASLIIDGDLTGRLTIRDENDFLVAELTKVNNSPMELGLGPGLYRIMIQRGDNFYRAEVFLRENTRTPLSISDFTRIASATGNRTRGSEETEAPPPFSFFSSGENLYTFIYNNVSEPFPYPLIGFINIARGNHRIAQLGFINWNSGNFTGFQGGFVNTIGGNLDGVQAGYINTVNGNVEGLQAGFINTAAGFMDDDAGDARGFQFGFINTAKIFSGAQGGFVNTAIRGGEGLQSGFVNVSLQKLRGVQLGFVNYADSIENGIPIGFISVVRNGGYRAVEYSFSEFYPINLGFKIGVERFYTTIFTAFNPFDEFSLKSFAMGWGIGSILAIGNRFFFNPELSQYSNFSFKDEWSFLSLVPFFGYRLGKHFSITAGPSVTWAHVDNNDQYVLPKPFFRIAEHSFTEDSKMGKNSIVVGARAALRFIF